jgi:hypothetical protein
LLLGSNIRTNLLTDVQFPLQHYNAGHQPVMAESAARAPLIHRKLIFPIRLHFSVHVASLLESALGLYPRIVLLLVAMALIVGFCNESTG